MKKYFVPIFVLLLFTSFCSYALCNTTHAKITPFDVIAKKDEEIELKIQLEKDDALGVNLDIENEKVIFYSERDKVIGEAVTDEDGFATMKYKVKNYGVNKVYVRLTNESHYKADEMFITIICPEDNIKFIVCDIDNTIARSDTYDLVFRTISDLKVIQDSNTILKKLSEKYYIIYLTHRYNTFTQATKKWLTKNDFPDGVLICSDLKDVLSSKKYKKKVMKKLKDRKIDLFIGIGNTKSDAKAYTESNLFAIIITGSGEKLPEKSYRVENWKEVLKAVETIENTSAQKTEE